MFWIYFSPSHCDTYRKWKRNPYSWFIHTKDGTTKDISSLIIGACFFENRSSQKPFSFSSPLLCFLHWPSRTDDLTACFSHIQKKVNKKSFCFSLLFELTFVKKSNLINFFFACFPIFRLYNFGRVWSVCAYYKWNPLWYWVCISSWLKKEKFVDAKKKVIVSYFISADSTWRAKFATWWLRRHAFLREMESPLSFPAHYVS